MKALRTEAALRNLRSQPLWRLLAADKAPVFLALLQSLFLEGARNLPSSILHERLSRDLDQLRASGQDLPQSPQAYIAEWLAQSWLTRRFPTGASEEEYALSTDAATAIRFLTGVLKPRTTATESRLSLVIQQLAQLAEETDPNPTSRLEALRAEQERINLAIAEVERGGVKVLPSERALERAREIIALAEELTADFRSVRDQFDELNRKLRQSLMENEGSRAEVLERLFAGVDLIGESDAGRTFNAFWRLLTDNEQSATLVTSLDEVTSRSFARELEPRERRFLLALTSTLLEEGGGVHDVLQAFARSLRTFVQSREFHEQRRLHALLKETTQAALAIKDLVRPNQSTGYELTLTSSSIESVSRARLYDPAERVSGSSMSDADAADLDIDAVRELVRQSEIDFRTLKQHVRSVLERTSQASIGDVLRVFPADQGLGSVVGLVALGAKHGEMTPGTEYVAWVGDDEVPRRATIPMIYFIRQRVHEFVE